MNGWLSEGVDELSSESENSWNVEERNITGMGARIRRKARAQVHELVD